MVWNQSTHEPSTEYTLNPLWISPPVRLGALEKRIPTTPVQSTVIRAVVSPYGERIGRSDLTAALAATVLSTITEGVYQVEREVGSIGV